jgi:biopolymer transport protein ExbB
MTIYGTFKEGGPVFVAILACGFCALAVFFERIVVLRRARIRFSDFLSGIFNILSKGKIREAVAICDETPGPVAKLAHSAISHRELPQENLREILDNTGKTEVARMERRLLGLLGGALGALKTVRTMQANLPLVQAVDLTTGLSSALVCASAGLAVAVIAYIALSIVSVRIDRVIIDMEQAAADIMAFMPSRGKDAPPTGGARETGKSK